MKVKKIVIAGAGALRTVQIARSAATLAKEFGKTELVLFDIDRTRLGLVERLVTLMPEYSPELLAVSSSLDFESAIDGADAVYSFIRVGGREALERDKKISYSHGFHGDDTYGPCAYTLAMRTAPVIMQMARSMEKKCPGAWLLIFTNPVIMLTDMVSRHTKIKVLGLCAGVDNFEADFEHMHGDPQERMELVYTGAGLNHFSWVAEDSTYKGEPLYDYLWRFVPTVDENKVAPECVWPYEKRIFEFTGRMPYNNGHFYHYFMYDEIVSGQFQRNYRSRPHKFAAPYPDAWAQAENVVKGGRTENFWQEMPFHRKERRDPDIGLRALFSIWYDLGWKMGVNVPNRGHTPDIPEGYVVEATSRLTAGGAEPLNISAVPRVVKGLTAAVAYQQRMVSQMALSPDRKQLLDSILADPCHRSLSRAESVANELWAAFKVDCPDA